jgi:glycosyltransferase involved in cell wall biosynthesis
MGAGYEVVVPVHRVERTIAETLDSLSAQSVAPERILIADDASPDASVDIAARYAGTEILRFEHSGLSGVQNRALEHVRAECVAYVDADDVWHPETGRLLVAALRATDAAAVSMGPDRFPDGERPALDDPLPPVWSEVGFEDLVRRNRLWKSGTMYRTAALQGVRGWREDLPITGDHDVALRLMEAGGTIFTTDWRGVGVRVSASSMSRNPVILREQLRVALPRLRDGDGAAHARTLWLRTLARAAEDGRDLRDVPALSELSDAAPRGQRALEALARSPLRGGAAAGWRAWKAR